jgi:hypothetical protein
MVFISSKRAPDDSRAEKQVTELTTDLQKVNAQLELSKVAPQTVLNNQ